MVHCTITYDSTDQELWKVTPPKKKKKINREFERENQTSNEN